MTQVELEQAQELRAQVEKSEQFIVVKSWQVLIGFLTLFAGALLSWASLRDESAENKRRIETLESRPVMTKDVFEYWQQESNRRLQQIETELQQQRSLNQLNREYDQKKRQ